MGCRSAQAQPQARRALRPEAARSHSSLGRRARPLILDPTSPHSNAHDTQRSCFSPLNSCKRARHARPAAGLHGEAVPEIRTVLNSYARPPVASSVLFDRKPIAKGRLQLTAIEV